MANEVTDYYRLGGPAGLKFNERQFNSDIQRSICVNPSKKLIYFKPGKAAGTSIFRVILQPMGGWIIQKDNPDQFSKWVENITDEKLNEYYKFIFVRNPYARLVSAWNDKKSEYNLNKNFKKFVMTENSIFVDGVPNYLHLQTQSSLIETPNGFKTGLNFIGKVESIDQDWQTLCLCADIPYRPMVKAQVRKHADYRTYYDSDTSNRIYHLYERDFEMFGYSKIL